MKLFYASFGNHIFDSSQTYDCTYLELLRACRGDTHIGCCLCDACWERKSSWMKWSSLKFVWLSLIVTVQIIGCLMVRLMSHYHFVVFPNLRYVSLRKLCHFPIIQRSQPYCILGPYMQVRTFQLQLTVAQNPIILFVFSANILFLAAMSFISEWVKWQGDQYACIYALLSLVSDITKHEKSTYVQGFRTSEYLCFLCYESQVWKIVSGSLALIWFSNILWMY